MGCAICGRSQVLHGAHVSPGSEAGCHNGVWMDEDEFAEGWQPDVMTRPCPNNPAACGACRGEGDVPGDADARLECALCDGTGWVGGVSQEPDGRYRDAPSQNSEETGNGR